MVFGWEYFEFDGNFWWSIPEYVQRHATKFSDPEEAKVTWRRYKSKPKFVEFL